MEGVPRGPPWPPDQPAQGLSTGAPLPQLRRVQGATKPAPLAECVSSSRRELLQGSGVAGTPSELETHKHLCEQRTPSRQETAGGGGAGGGPGGWAPAGPAPRETQGPKRGWAWDRRMPWLGWA